MITKFRAWFVKADMSLAEQTDYLNEKVYPTLLPLLEKLLKTVKREAHHDGTGEMREDEQFDPLDWLGQQLMRQNPNKKHGESVEKGTGM